MSLKTLTSEMTWWSKCMCYLCVHECVYLCVWTYVCLWVYLCIFLCEHGACLCVNVGILMSEHMSMCDHVHSHVFMCTRVYLYAYTCMPVYTHVFAQMCMCINACLCVRACKCFLRVYVYVMCVPTFVLCMCMYIFMC